MGAKPGPKLGSHNKNTKFLLNRLKDMYGEDFEPVMKMAENAAEIQKLVDEALKDKNPEVLNLLIKAIEAWSAIAKHTTPQLKALEVSGNPDSPLLGGVKLEIIRDKHPAS